MTEGHRLRRPLDAAARGPAEDDGASLYMSTFSRTVWRLYGGAKGLVMWYYLFDHLRALHEKLGFVGSSACRLGS